MATKWDEKRSRWYCRAIEQSDYPKKAVTALHPLLRTCDSVIDIGAGCGALSVPIAGLVKRVTAIEPSIWMYNLLLKRAKDAGDKNIRAYNTGWKGSGLEGYLDSRLKPHDMVICANLPHEVICNAKFLRYITEKAKKFVVYVQSAGEWNRFYYKDLYPLLFRRKYICEGDYVKTYAFLYQHGIFANIKISDYCLDQPFEDFNDALAFWRHRLKKKLSSREERILADFLRKKLIRSGRNNTLIAPFGLRRTAFMWWKP